MPNIPSVNLPKADLFSSPASKLYIGVVNAYRRKKHGISKRKQLDRVQGFLMLPPDADELAKFRFQICQEILKYSQQEKLNAVQIAKLLGIPKSDMSRIFNHRIDRFSTDKLVRLFAKIKPDFQLKVA